MIKIGEVLVSDDVVEKEFVCNLDKCKGACCVEGDFGAPLDENELAILEEIYPIVKPYLTKEGIKVIEKEGTHTTIYDKKGILKCGIEQAYLDGKIGWKKPISCHLYPIRITSKKNFEALNYHKWSICSPACALGKELQVPVYKFLKDPLIRKYGEKWYTELVQVVETLQEPKEKPKTKKSKE
jgi:hypothetical protein